MKVGDRVKVVGGGNYILPQGKIGKIIKIENDGLSSYLPYLVDFGNVRWRLSKEWVQPYKKLEMELE